MILVIDNYDSFVYNLARYVEISGHETHVVRNDKFSLAEIKDLAPSHIVISPGPCTPNEAGVCLELVKNFYTQIPILGVCLGHQVIAQAFGALITKAQEPMHGKASEITHNQQGIFNGIPSPINVGRYHSLIVENIPIDSGLIITAKSSQGEIMALTHEKYPLFGVQFHPEAILTTHGQIMINNFVKTSSTVM